MSGERLAPGRPPLLVEAVSAWLAFGLGAWLGAIGGFMLAAVLGAGHRKDERPW